MKDTIKKISWWFSVLLLISNNFSCQTKKLDDKEVLGEYLGQKPPGMVAEKFAPGKISTDKSELNCVFTPDGKEVYFSEWNAGVNTIMMMQWKDGKWSERKIAPFSGKYSDVDPFITADGQRLYFSSMRPIDANGESKDSDIWYVERLSDGKWSAPINKNLPNSPGKDDYYTSITNNGTLYFSLFEKHGSPGDIYRSKLLNGKYSAPEKVEFGISTENNEHDPFVSPDENYLIFSSDRPEGFGRNDLYISFKLNDGSWSNPINMGEKINSDGYDFCPMLSQDGKYLFFTRNINRNGDIYWISAEIIEELRSKE